MESEPWTKLTLARLTLLALETTTGGGTGPALPSIEISGYEGLLDDTGAIELLANLEKPVQCMAAVRNGHLSISCAPYRPDGDSSELATLERLRQLRALALQLQFPSAGSMVFVRGESDGMLIPLALVERWRDEYVLPSAQGTLFDADEEAKAQGAVARLVFGMTPPRIQHRGSIDIRVTSQKDDS